MIRFYLQVKMSSKRSSGKLEVDVQRFRDEGSWKKIIEIAEQQSGKVGVDGNPCMFHLLAGAHILDWYRAIDDIPAR